MEIVDGLRQLEPIMINLENPWIQLKEKEVLQKVLLWFSDFVRNHFALSCTFQAHGFLRTAIVSTVANQIKQCHQRCRNVNAWDLVSTSDMKTNWGRWTALLLVRICSTLRENQPNAWRSIFCISRTSELAVYCHTRVTTHRRSRTNRRINPLSNV